MASREEVSSLGEVNGVRSRVDMEDYDTPENNGRRPAVLAADGGMSPDALDYESTDDDSTLTQPADDVRFGTASAAGVPVTGATRGEVAYDRAAAQASVYESNVGKVPDAERGADDAPAKDVEKSDAIEATKAEIEHTRAELSETIDAIKEKLSPAHLVAEAKEATVGAASDAVHHVVDAVKDKASDTVHGVMDSVKDKATSVLDVVKGKAAIAVDAAKGAGQMIADKVSQARTNNDGGTGVNATSGNAPVVASSSATLSASPITYHDRTGTLAAASGGHSLGATIVDTIKVNPLPAAIAGFGLGWLLLSIQRQSRSSAFVSGGSGGSFRPHEDYGRDYAVPDLTPRNYTSDTYATAPNLPITSAENGSGPGLKEKASNLASGVADKASGLASGVAGKASDLTHNVADKASGLASSVTEKASNVAGSVTAKASDLAHAASDTASSLKDKASTLAVGAKDKASDLAHGIGDKASDLKETTKVQYRAASESIGGFVEEQPLVAGALAILAGAALGYLLPGTEKENRLIGPKRDQLMEKAGDAVQNVAQKVQTVAETALGQAKESLSETVEVAKDQIQHAVEETKQSVKNEVKGQGLNSPATAIS